MSHTLGVAQESAPTAPETASSAKAPVGCVDVVVNGHAALSYDCLNQQLRPKEGPAGPPAGLASEAVTQRSPNALGLFNQAATSNRMGSNFGTSAFPQRPPRLSTPHPFAPPQP
ncbi:hypothetical protein [Alcaligenes faecalis]|uniref:hypothetical protein n=1 Tax=Alcaligenes faecalis TaxID=511 RepID=UPI001EF06E73|nr:hypothetical protein [Alcaligenes faecalis]ULH06479.1 hypothetical protein MF263_17640 [Alcaligenes faecalis]